MENKKNIQNEVYNLGNSSPVTLNEFIKLCEEVTNQEAIYEEIPMQLGDVPHTYADISKAKNDLDYEPKTLLKDGLNSMFKSML